MTDAVAPNSAQSPALVTTTSISAEAALGVAQAGVRAGRGRNCDVAVAVVDRAGLLLLLLRTDGATERFVEGAIQKAWTALNLRTSTRDAFATIQQGHQDNSQLPFIPRSLFGSTVVGAIGAAGCVDGLDDDAVAQEAAEEFHRLAG